jgi:hypothetical protein
MRCFVLAALAAVLGLGLFTGTASAQFMCHWSDHTFERAGHPEQIAWYARPSDTGRYIGYYVGGGNPFYRHGQDRYLWEGTWGWDYCGFCLPSRVVLDWFHGRYQGGYGAYKTDGPHFVEQVVHK